MKRIIIYLFATILILFSCKKEKSPTTISGKIVMDCSGTPMANQSLELYAQGIRALGRGGGYYSFTTDDNGNFSVQNEVPITGEELHIQYSNGGRSLLELTGRGDVNIGTLNTKPTANYQLKIKVNNTYSAGDTLRISNYNGIRFVHYKFPAPLKDTILPIVNNYSNGLQVLENLNKVLVRSSPLVYSGQMGTSTFTYKFEENLNYYLDGCQGGVQEILITIN